MSSISSIELPPQAREIARVLGEALPSERVYLFGSYARGHAGPDSDLDFMVIVPFSDKTRYERAVLARRHVREIAFPKDIIVLTRAEWERDLKAPSSLSSSIVREGVSLFP